MSLKWSVEFKFKEIHSYFLKDLKETPLFEKKYPVFKVLLLDEILKKTAKHYHHIRRTENPSEIKDPTGKKVPQDSGIFIWGNSSEMGFLEALFFMQPDERLVLVGLDEIWIQVLEKYEAPQRLTVLTNILASLLNTNLWDLVYLLY